MQIRHAAIRARYFGVDLLLHFVFSMLLESCGKAGGRAHIVLNVKNFCSGFFGASYLIYLDKKPILTSFKNHRLTVVDTEQTQEIANTQLPSFSLSIDGINDVESDWRR